MSKQAIVTNVILGYSVLRLKPFSVNGTSFDPFDLTRLAFKMMAGSKPTVKTNTTISFNYYNPAANELWFKFNQASNVMEKSIVIHEATHAVCDMNSAKMTVADSEAMAYIVQCQYASLNNPYPNERYLKGNTDKSDRVFQIAWVLGEKAALSTQPITASDIDALKQAIAANPTYAAEAANDANYNGI